MIKRVKFIAIHYVHIICHKTGGSDQVREIINDGRFDLVLFFLPICLFVCFFFYQKCTLILKRKHQKSYFTSISSSILELVPEFKNKVDFSSGCLHLLDDQESAFECGYTSSSCEFTESNFYIFQTRVLIKIKHFRVKCFSFKPPDLPQKNLFYVLKYMHTQVVTWKTPSYSY